MTDSLDDEMLTARLFAVVDIRSDTARARRVMELIAAAPEAIRPDGIVDLSKEGDALVPFTPEKALAIWSRGGRPVHTLSLGKSGVPFYDFEWSDSGRGKQRVTSVSWLASLSLFAGPGTAAVFVDFIAALAREIPCTYGYANETFDIDLGERPLIPSQVPDRPSDVYWLNLFGSDMVERIGRDRVKSTPAHRLELFPDGGAMVVAHLSPLDYWRPEAADARAAALAHVRPDVPLEAARERYRKRAETLMPVERDWDPDLEHLIREAVDREPLENRRKREQDFNGFRPPVTEWAPADEAPPAELDPFDEGDKYSGWSGDLDIVAHSNEVDIANSDEPEFLALLDRHFWQDSYDYFETQSNRDKIVRLVGAALGGMLVDSLDGEWRPRKNLEETSVIVGDRAWFPFKRARNLAKDKDSVLQHSLYKLYREAERHARERGDEGITEWAPADQAPPAELDAFEEGDRYAGLAGDLDVVLQDKGVDVEGSDEPGFLYDIDRFFYTNAATYFDTDAHRDKIVPLIGAALGEMLAAHLDGEWRPRKNLDETSVVVGDRAWFPFRRARNLARDKDSVLQHSLYKLYRAAARHAGKTGS